MAELVYAFDLKSNEGTRAGSIPAPSTKNTEKTTCSLFLYFERGKGRLSRSEHQNALRFLYEHIILW